MNVEQPAPFEVYCQRCRVSFPVGTRSCIHCGERIGRARSAPAPARLRPGAERRHAGVPPPVLDEVEDELPVRSGVMSPVAILWLVLILGGAIYRACS